MSVEKYPRRADTAILIALLDLAILAVLGTCIASWPNQYPQSALIMVVVGMTFVGFRSAFLFIFGVGLTNIGTFLSELMRDQESAIGDASNGNGNVTKGAASSTTAQHWLDSHTNEYLALVAIGIVGLMLTVIATGGFVESPFSTILVTSFILAQIRSPLTAVFWKISASGLAVSLVLWAGHTYVRTNWPAGFGGAELIPDLSYVLPLILVAIASTVVNYFTVAHRIQALPQQIGASPVAELPVDKPVAITEVDLEVSEE